MSRVGKLPVAIPSGVQVDYKGQQLSVKGKKGEQIIAVTDDVVVTVDNGQVVVKPANDSKRSRAMWGTTRANVMNMVKGVTDGFSKTIEIRGVGFRASVQGKLLALTLG